VIAFLQGQILQVENDVVILNVRGVGYEVHVSAQTAQGLSGTSAQLWIHTHLREDSLQLFGFSSRAEKELFLSLNKVNGIGPKVAMKILSGAPLATIISMIDAGDVSGLSKLPKVGKKTAEQIILELKGKLVLAEENSSVGHFSARTDIISALVHLGFKVQDVEKVVNQMDAHTQFEEGIKRGLSQLSNTF